MQQTTIHFNATKRTEQDRTRTEQDTTENNETKKCADENNINPFKHIYEYIYMLINSTK